MAGIFCRSLVPFCVCLAVLAVFSDTSLKRRAVSQDFTCSVVPLIVDGRLDGSIRARCCGVWNGYLIIHVLMYYSGPWSANISGTFFMHCLSSTAIVLFLYFITPFCTKLSH